MRRDLLQRHCRTVHNIRLVLRPPLKESPENKRDDAAISPASPDDGRAEVALAKMLLLLVPAVQAEEARAQTQAQAQTQPLTQVPLALAGLARPGLARALSPSARLYAVAKKISSFYDPTDLRYPMDEIFLAGYGVLANDPAVGFQGLEFVNHFSELPEPVCDFKIGIAYTLLAAGALTVPADDYDREEVATMFMNRAWNVFVERLMPKNASIDHQSEILRNLYLLTYTYLRYFNNSLMVPYLEDSAVVIFQNLTLQPNSVLARIVHLNLSLFWRVYILVSKHKAKEMPPKFYSWFLSQQVDPKVSESLSALMLRYSLAHHLLSDPFLCDIITCTLSNELNNFLITKALWIFDLEAALHKAIIMVNRSLDKAGSLQSSGSSASSISSDSCSVSLSPSLSSSLLDSVLDIFSHFKEKLTVDAPPQLRSILNDYVFRITAPYHWDLLSLTLREFNSNFNFSRFMKENLHSTFQKFGNDLLRFFSHDSILESRILPTPADLFDNLAIVSYPLLFNCNFLRLTHVPPSIVVADLDIIDLTNLNNLLLEWQVTVVKVLVNLVSGRDMDVEKSVSESAVLQGLLYMLSEESSEVEYTPEFFLLIFNKLTKISDMWLRFVNKSEAMSTLRANLHRFLSDLFVLALNNDRLIIEDLYVTNESILIRSRRSKSIGSIDMRTSPFKKEHRMRMNSIVQTPLLTLPSITTTNNSNYVLMNKPPTIQEHKIQWNGTVMTPSSSLPPLQNLQVTNPNMTSPLAGGVPSGNPLLPPLRSTVKGLSEDNFTTTE